MDEKTKSEQARKRAADAKFAATAAVVAMAYALFHFDPAGLFKTASDAWTGCSAASPGQCGVWAAIHIGHILAFVTAGALLAGLAARIASGSAKGGVK